MENVKNLSHYNPMAAWKREKNSESGLVIPVSIRVSYHVSSKLLELLQARKKEKKSTTFPPSLLKRLKAITNRSSHVNNKSKPLFFFDSFALTTLTYAEAHEFDWTTIVVFVLEEALELLAPLEVDTEWLQIIDIGVPTRYKGGAEPKFPDTIPIDKRSSDDIIVATIDSGIAFANQRFRTNLGKTRFKAMWCMDAIPTIDSTIAFGRQWTATEIDNAISTNPDDDAIYKKLNALRIDGSTNLSVLRRISHGTHVLDIASGYDPITESKIAIRRPLLGVQLPAAVVADTSGCTTPPFLVLALEWILRQALSMKADNSWLPLVVNWSFGITSGPCDGASSIERTIDDFLDRYRKVTSKDCEFVLPAGNSFQGQNHANFQIDDKNEAVLTWFLPPDDKTDSFVTVFIPHSMDPERVIEVEIATPQPIEERVISKLGQQRDLKIGNSILARLYHYRDNRDWVDTPAGEVVTIAVKPTASDVYEPVAPHGNWTIRIKQLNCKEPINIVARIQRDDTPHGVKRSGRQSRFIDKNYLVYDNHGRQVKVDNSSSKIKRSGSFNAYATSRNIVAVGGYIASTGEPSSYSCGGPLLEKPGPDISAVSDRSIIEQGVLASGSASGSKVSMRGTSVAAPMVTRRLAELFSEKKTRADLQHKKTMFGSMGKYAPLDYVRHGKARI